MITKIYQMGNKLGLYFPKKERRFNKGDLVILTINNNREKEIIAKFNYNITIRNQFIKSLNLKKGDIIEIDLKKLESLEKPKELFFKGKIDLLSLISNKTSQGYEIIAASFIKDNEEWIRLWYSHNRGSGRQLELRRFIDIAKFGSLLGQYQAEGTKHKNHLNKFYTQFSNKLIEEHLDFLESLKEIGIPKEVAEFKLVYNPKTEKDIEDVIEKFKKTISPKLKISTDNQPKGRGISLIIRNTVLTETILNSMDKVRKILAVAKTYNLNQQILANAFFAKLLTGDGTIDIRVKNREYDYPATKIRITDQDLKYLQDYGKIMKNLNFTPKIKENNILVQSICGINQLLYLYKIEAFKNSKNWYKLLLNIDLALKGRRLTTLKRYSELTKQDNFDTLAIAKRYNVITRSAYDWLYNATKEGFVEKITKVYTPGKPTLWTTTAKARGLVSTLEQWEKDLVNLKENKKIQDSHELLESLKTKGKNLTKESS